jgi:hypothetical protein
MMRIMMVMSLAGRASFQWAEETLEYLYQQGYTTSKVLYSFLPRRFFIT